MKSSIFRLSDICKIKSGKRLPLGMELSTEPTPYMYIRARDIKSGKISIDDVAYIESNVKSKIDKYIIETGDIALTIVANIGDVGYCDKNANGANLTENAIRLTDFDVSKVKSRYLSYYLSMPFMKHYMEGLSAGAAQAKLGIYKIEKIKVDLPLTETQNRVIDFLVAYDELIEKNNRKIAILQEQAQELYKEWFVRFRFPGHEQVSFKKSKLGNIPCNFSVIKASDAIEYYIGGGWGNDEKDNTYCKAAYVVRGTDFASFMNGQTTSIPYRFHKESNLKSRQLCPNDIIMEISGGTADQPVGRTAFVTKEKLDRFDTVVMCASFCKQIRCSNILSPVFYYYWLQFLYQNRVLDRFQLQSTGISNFQFEFFLRKCDTLHPPKDLMILFENKAKSILHCIDTISTQNENLTNQRDLLLPRLMSGKLEVN